MGYKSALSLGLEKAEKKALIGVMRKLKAGDLKYGKNFDMDKWDCGSIHCIGGWADELFGTNFNNKPSATDLDELFFAYKSGIPKGEITHTHAAKAIKNFLTFGKPNWKIAVSDH